MTLRYLAYKATESALTVGSIFRMLGEIALCRVAGHSSLEWHRMTTVDVGKCSRCWQWLEWHDR